MELEGKIQGMKEDNILKIKGSEVRIETTEEIVEGSYFNDEYIHAFQVVQGIIDRNFSRNPSSEMKIHNIVPFIGKRGSGKTSAMMSFSGILARYYKEQNSFEHYPYVFKNPKGEEEKVRFFCIDCIDGSLLEKGEDIFKLILAQMYRSFLERDEAERSKDRSYEYEKRELQQYFDKVYRGVCKLEQENYKEPYYEESSIISLKNLSSSLALVREFNSLVQQYLKLFMEIGDDLRQYYDHVKPFLVIMVDDLDLNIYKGYEMLEKLHRYMMVPNVVVMLSVDYDQIKLLCEKQLYQMVPNFDSKLNEKRKAVERVARDFLDKVFPGNVRIYMPRFELRNDIQICMLNDNKNPREFLFELLYEKLELRVDIEGTKRHYYEQNSLRTFVSFFLMLYKMQPVIKKISDETEDAFSYNYKLLMSDTLNRMADERLDSNHKEIFDKIVKTDLLHSAKTLYAQIVQYMYIEENYENSLSWQEKNERKKLGELAQNIRFAGYNYGELLRIIYCWGRIDNDCKEMVRCLLAYFSLEFFKISRQEMEFDVKRRKLIHDIMGGSVLGSWANLIVPKIRILQSKAQMMGMRVNIDMSKVISVNLEDFSELGKLTKQNEDHIYQITKTFLLWTMFFDQLDYTKNSYRWSIKKVKNSENQIKLEKVENPEKNSEELKICGSGIANFNIFGFVTNAFYYKENVRPLLEQFCEIIGLEISYKDKILNKFDSEFSEWQRISKGFVIPVYNMDVTYNLFKRLRQEEKGRKEVTPEEFWKELIDIYRFVYTRLQRNDEWYQEHNLDVQIKYADAFCECPYMKAIFQKSDKGLKTIYEERMGEDFEKELYGIFENVMNNSSSMDVETERETEYYGYYD